MTSRYLRGLDDRVDAIVARYRSALRAELCASTIGCDYAVCRDSWSPDGDVIWYDVRIAMQLEPEEAALIRERDEQDCHEDDMEARHGEHED